MSQVVHIFYHTYVDNIRWVICGHCVIEEEGADLRDFFKEYQVHKELE